jgi:hypothetical protein
MITKLLGFFLGFFITIILINYFTVENLKLETFKNLDKFTDPAATTPAATTPAATTPAATTPAATTPAATTPAATTPAATTPATTTPATPEDLANSRLIPFKDNKYMCINTFGDSTTTKIKNNEKRWYECDLTNIIGVERNENHYFTYDKDINLIPNDINKNGSMGAAINGIQLNGPKSFYFANNINTNELTEFSMIISAKIKNIGNQNNILFEMTGNTETTDNINLQYSQSIININLKQNPNNNFDIIITVGNVVYKGLINDIDRNSIINNDFIVIGLVYSATEISFYLNRRKFTYTNSEKFKVKLGSAPIIINKGGSINMDLYSFIYYKTVVPMDQINKLTKYNYYYLSGLDFTISESNKCAVNQPPPEIKTLGDRLKELENNIINIIEKKSYKEPVDIKPLSLNNDQTKMNVNTTIKPLSLNVSDNLISKNKLLNWFF